MSIKLISAIISLSIGLISAVHGLRVLTSKRYLENLQKGGRDPQSNLAEKTQDNIDRYFVVKAFGAGLVFLGFGVWWLVSFFI